MLYEKNTKGLHINLSNKGLQLTENEEMSRKEPKAVTLHKIIYTCPMKKQKHE